MKREELNYILQHSNIEALKKLYEDIDRKFGISVISKPSSQTILVPIKDPISGGEFYAGEVLVTSTIVEINKNKGWSMIQDDYKDLSLYVACCDAVFDTNEFNSEIIKLCQETKLELENKEKIVNKKVNSTRVNFDLMQG